MQILTMKIKHLYILLTLILGLPWMAFAQPFGGGSGTEGDPYLITSSADWNALADKLEAGTEG